MDEVWRWLEDAGAHHDVVTWAKPFGADFERAWRECPRGDWLLGIAARAGADRAAIVRGAIECARFALEYLPDGEPRPAAALDAAGAWLDGADDPAARRRALADVEAAIDAAPDPAVAAAASAALAALSSVDSPDDAPGAVSGAVQAALMDAGDCAMMSAAAYAQQTCADHVRAHVPTPAFDAPR